MVVYEIENMETHERAYAEANSEQEMIDVLKEKGFTEVPGLFLACHNSEGQEISAMKATFRNVKALKPIK